MPFGAEFSTAQLPFGLDVLPEGEALTLDRLDSYDIAEVSGDMTLDFGLADLAKQNRCKVVFVIEYTLKTRLQILLLDDTLSYPKKLRSAAWNLLQETGRTRAMKAADGLQANGYPAFTSYRAHNENTMLYLDNRMRPDMFATREDCEARAQHLATGRPLRLINSGRLERMKGAQDLVPLSVALRARGVDHTLDIYGTGRLEQDLKDAIAKNGLEDIVRPHAPVDFETELVPLSRREADIFVSCHRQSDPSCSYLEAMGCGLPVIGYSNQMLGPLIEDSQAGWTVGLGDVGALADRIAALSRSRTEITAAGTAALAFAKRHGFEDEFAKRRQHLLGVLESI